LKIAKGVLMNLSDLLTIVIVSKEDEIGLQRTLNSLLKFGGAYPNVTLVLSYEKQLQIIDTIKKYPFTPKILFENSSGVYQAMNLGLVEIETPFVWFLNGGDEYYGTIDLFKILKVNINKSLIIFGVEIRDNFTNSKRTYRLRFYSKLLHRLGLIFIPHPGAIFKTNLLKFHGGFKPNLKIAADQEALYALAKTKYFSLNKENLAIFHLGGLSTRKSDEIVNDFREISRINHGFFLNWLFFDQIIWKCIFYLRRLKTIISELF